MPLSDTTAGAASTGTSDKTFWTGIQSFFTTLVLGCFVDLARNKRTSVPAALIWRLLSQLLAVTIHIHHEGVIHRDIKASNVFLHWKADDASLPDFFLGDFGVACRRNDRANGFGQHIFDFRMLFNLAKLAANLRAVSSGTVPAPRGRGGESIDALFRVFEKFDRTLLNFETMRDKEEFMQGMCELEKEVKGEKEMRKEDQKEYKLEAEERLEVFEGEEALLLAPKPLGPWKIAEMEQRGGEWMVKKVLNATYCKDETMFT